MVDILSALAGAITLSPLIAIAWYLAKNPEKIEKWSSMISKGLSSLSIRWEKNTLANDIQTDINSFSQSIDPQNGFLPYKIKIDWVSRKSKEAFIREGKVVVKMRRYGNQARNFLYATIEYTEKGLLPESRHLMDKRVLSALELAFINKLLTERKRFDSRQLFIDEIYEEQAKEGSLIKKYSEAFINLDDKGVFAGVVLPEYSLLGKTGSKEIQNEKIMADTIGFAEMLSRLANKRHGHDVDPNYKGSIISCAIVLIARSETYEEKGLAPYITYINGCVEKGTRCIYVCGIGEKNIYIAQQLRDGYESSKRVKFNSQTTKAFQNSTAIVLKFDVLPVSNKKT